MHNTVSIQENDMRKILSDFLHKNGSSNVDQTTRPSNSKQINRTCRRVNSAFPTNISEKLKGSKNSGMYLHFAREQQKRWNMKMTVKTIMNDELGTVTKKLVQGLENLKIRGRV